VVVVFAVLRQAQRITIAFQTSSGDCGLAIRIFCGEQFIAQDAVIALCISVSSQTATRGGQQVLRGDPLMCLTPCRKSEGGKSRLGVRGATHSRLADLHQTLARSVEEGEMS
jgi:hypothetical protein